MRDGVSWHCDRCGYHEGNTSETIEEDLDIMDLPYSNIAERRLREDTCKFYDVRVSRSEENTSEL
jgi:hypothetical protein